MKYLLLLLLFSFSGLGQPFPLYSARTAPTFDSTVYSDAQLIYSMRRIEPTYAGPCLRLIRITDNVEQDIGFVSGAVNALIDTNAASAFGASGDCYVIKWYTQKGINHLLQPVLLRRPNFVSGGVVFTSAGKPAIDFHPITYGKMDLTTPMSGTAPWTVSAVFNNLASDHDWELFTVDGTGAPCVRFIAIGTQHLYVDTDSHYWQFSDSYNFGPLIGFFSVGASASPKAWLSGATYTMTTLDGPFAGGSFQYIGANSDIGPNYHDGSMQELIFWNSDKEADQPAINADQNAYFGIY